MFSLDPTVAHKQVFYSVYEEDEVVQVCVELLSQGPMCEQVDVTLNTADGTASGNIVIIVLLESHVCIPHAVPTDYTALIDEVLVFPAGSVMGDTVCVEILIINDFVLELYEENFFVNITSNDANISPGLESATILIQDSDQGICMSFKWQTLCTKVS